MRRSRLGRRQGADPFGGGTQLLDRRQEMLEFCSDGLHGGHGVLLCVRVRVIMRSIDTGSTGPNCTTPGPPCDTPSLGSPP